MRVAKTKNKEYINEDCKLLKKDLNKKKSYTNSVKKL